jgi:DNA-binding MurR/RpiR family transcriptional regulator
LSINVADSRRGRRRAIAPTGLFRKAAIGGAERGVASLEETIKKDWKTYTPAEQKLATYFLARLQELPFETAASIGKQVEVSAMTVGRFIRKLGYADLGEIKAELRAGAVDLAWSEEVSRAAFASASLKARIKGVTEVHKIPETPEWPRIVSMIASARVVRVASFQVGRFLGLGFATFLQSLRPGVYFSDGGDGSYADVLLDLEPDACLILIDFRRYSRHFRLLAEEAAVRNIRTIILTDVYCHWARALTDNVLMIETDFGIRSLSMAQLLFELLLAAVAAQLEGTSERADQLNQLRERFVGFVGSETPRRRRNGEA